MHQVLYDLNLVDKGNGNSVIPCSSYTTQQQQQQQDEPHFPREEKEQQVTLSSCDVLNQLLLDKIISENDIRNVYKKLTDQANLNQQQKQASSNQCSILTTKACPSIVNNPTPTSVIQNEPKNHTIATEIVQQSTSKDNVVDISLSQVKTKNQQRFKNQNRTRHIAFHIYYDGGKYSGLAENVGCTIDQSIERELFKALKKSNLIENTVTRESIKYSRCGRTDRGVSAVGQIVALYVKSSIPLAASYDKDGKIPIVSKDISSTNPLQPIHVWVPPTKKVKNIKNYNNNSKKQVIQERECSRNDEIVSDSHGLTMNGSSNDGQTQQEDIVRIERTIVEYRYDKILNNLLPVEIRVLGWCPVTDDFSARFSAMTRTYRYFFIWRPTYNVQRINDALQLLVGYHDYRNFCKMDIEKVYNFYRKIISCQLFINGTEYTNSTNNDDTTSTNTATTTENEQIQPSIQSTCYIQIQGQAFLWHQIRCIAHIVLDLIGCGYEEPSIITDLFDIDKYGGKPSYPLADELPLVLHDCQYTNLPINYTVPNLWNVSCQLEEVWDKLMLHAIRIRNCIDTLETKTVYTSDLVSYVSTSIEKIRKKQKSINVLSTTQNIDTSIANLETLLSSVTDTTVSDKCSWSDALQLLKLVGLLPDPTTKMKLLSYTPLLQRSKGTTYEEKVAALTKTASSKTTQSTSVDVQLSLSSSSSQQEEPINMKRRQRYEDNVIRKRKTKEEDAAFYNHMAKQGGI